MDLLLGQGRMNKERRKRGCIINKKYIFMRIYKTIHPNLNCDLLDHTSKGRQFTDYQKNGVYRLRK